MQKSEKGSGGLIRSVESKPSVVDIIRDPTGVQMGFKRPRDDDFEEFSVRHPKHLDCGNKSTSFPAISPSHNVFPRCDSPGEEAERVSQKYGSDNEIENGDMSDLGERDLEEDGGTDVAFASALCPAYFHFNFTRRVFEDTYSFFLNSSPRKEVPVGLNYQAELPCWDPNHDVPSDEEVILMGTCVLPFPDSGISAEEGVSGKGRTDCSCLDEGSIRCVRQHVEEGRQKLIKVLGQDKFVALGLCEMGEKVALKWTAEEEHVFHDVVYSNPASCDKNFWQYLDKVFPYRTKKELVNYYFNVFMLRRRAVQNRSSSLEIDSDDDEWHEDHERSSGLSWEGEDSAAGTHLSPLMLRDNLNFSEDDSSHQHEDEDDHSHCDNVDDDDGGVNCDDDCAGDFHTDCDVGVGLHYPTDKDGAKGQLKLCTEKYSDCQPGGVVNHVDKLTRTVVGDPDLQDDSRTSSDSQLHRTDSHGSTDVTENCNFVNVLTTSVLGHNDESSDGLGSDYLLEPPPYSKDWDEAAFPMGPSKGVDFLPTCNMMEEIFGPSPLGAVKTSNDGNAS